jgi:hypothetical protein
MTKLSDRLEALAEKAMPGSLVAMNETEKAIGRYVCGLAIEDEKISWPHWKLFFWALLHPVKFSAAHARLKALHDVADAIERGEHRKREKE